MFNKTIQDAINKQINNEFSASYTYLAMSAYCEHQNFNGCARWLRMQSQEESGHGMKLIDLLLARNGVVELQAVPKPPVDFKSVAGIFDQALKQEEEVSSQIDDLYELAFKERAFATLVELQWFLTEQVEEEKTAREIVAKFQLAKNDPASLLDIDSWLGSRTSAT